MKKSTLYILVLMITSMMITSCLLIIDIFRSNNISNNIDQNISEPRELPKITIDNVIVFDLENVSSRFVTLGLSITSDEVIDLTLDEIVTSENLSLSQNEDLVIELIGLGMDKNLVNIVDELPEGLKSYTVNLLIPIIDKNKKDLSLKIDKYNGLEYKISLDSITGTSEMLGIFDDGKLVDEAEFTIRILDVSDLTGKTVFELNTDGTKSAIDFPSTAKIHAIYIEIDPKSSAEIEITSARYRILDNNEPSYSLPSNNTVESLSNLINVKVNRLTKGYVFFDVYSDNVSLMDKKSVFEFKVSTSDEWYEVQVID